MDSEHKSNRPAHRLRFYGAGDYATYWQSQQAAELVESLNPAFPPDDINGIIELHNARLFVEADFIPREIAESEGEALAANVKTIRRIVAQWFNDLEDGNLASRLASVDWQYGEQLLDLLASFGVFGRCSASEMLSALEGANIRLGDMLTSKRLVENYDATMRERILYDSGGAESIIRHWLESEPKKKTFLPKSFTVADSRALMESYIEAEDPNLNHLKLIVDAPISRQAGIDAKLVVKARRRIDELNKSFFEGLSGAKTGCTVSVSSVQDEPAKATLNGLMIEYSFSQTWLDSTLDFPSVLNNFQFLFEFAPYGGLLTLPAFSSEIRGLERIIGLRGASDYQTGVAFFAKDSSTLLQTMMYVRYLAAKEIYLEDVLRWYFEEHLPTEYGVSGFAYAPSSRAANYLERCRNLFAEMESIATQFGLVVEDGKIDHELAAAGADLVRYRNIPSSLAGKYVYVTDREEVRMILHILFSDQSHLTFINEELRGDNAVDLLLRNEVSYELLRDHQRPLLDKLVEIGLFEDLGSRIALKNPYLLNLFKSLNDFEAVSYYHLDTRSRAHVDTMVSDGWLVRRASLLTEQEAAYFNYNLNSVDFSNGPKLRNKYQHGIQPRGDGEAQHEQTYYMALRLMVALTIKINDEFWLLDAMEKRKGEG